jgi:hypothetical protein
MENEGQLQEKRSGNFVVWLLAALLRNSSLLDNQQKINGNDAKISFKNVLFYERF